MRILLRALIILVVASLIGGLLYMAVVNVSDSASSSSFAVGRPGDDGLRLEGGERDDREGGFGFPGGIIKALVLMTIAGGIYSVIVWTGKQAKRSTAR